LALTDRVRHFGHHLIGMSFDHFNRFP